MTSKRGQVATEFMMYATIFLFVVIVAFVVVNHIQMTEIPMKENTVAKETGEGFVNVMTLAVKGGQGFTYNYTFPRNLYTAIDKTGRPYRLYFLTEGNESMILEWEGSYGNFSYAYSLPSYEYYFEVDGTCIKETGVPPVPFVNSSACPRIFLSNDRGLLTISRG